MTPHPASRTATAQDLKRSCAHGFAAPQDLNIDFSACGPFERNPTLAVAVSGGADSMALLLLAHDWAKAKGGRAIALTVDHGLRLESAEEAQLVHGWCKTRGIEHHILRVQDSAFRIERKTQDAARQARYRLLTEWCKKHNILHLLTAHHQGDQAETLFFRLARGSGLDGLACMPLISSMHGVRLLRSLLSLPKESLEATLTGAGQSWVEDPTNRDTRYTRNRIRESLLMRPENPSYMIENTVKKLGKIRNILENNAASYLTNSVFILPEGYGMIHLAELLKLAPEYRLRALSALVMTLSGDAYPPRSEKLERLHEEIMAGKIKRRSFAGLLFIHRQRGNRLLVCREPKAMEGVLEMRPDSTCLWDNRFEVSWSGNINGAVSVRALGTDGLKSLDMRPPRGMEKPALVALPAFWSLEELLAIPHMGYRNLAYPNLSCAARFRPAKALAAQAFCAMNTR